MTLEELTELKSRIAKAELHKTRIDRLQDALVKLSDVSQLRLAVQGSLPTIQYATSLTPEPSWTRVCWAEQELDMPRPLLETTDVDYMREQFVAWMDGARARARGLTMQDIPHPPRTRKGDSWENGWEVIDLELASAASLSDRSAAATTPANWLRRMRLPRPARAVRRQMAVRRMRGINPITKVIRERTVPDA